MAIAAVPSKQQPYDVSDLAGTSSGKEFRALPDYLREKLTGTAARTLDLAYDDVHVDEMREALRKLQRRRIRRSA